MSKTFNGETFNAEDRHCAVKIVVGSVGALLMIPPLSFGLANGLLPNANSPRLSANFHAACTSPRQVSDILVGCPALIGDRVGQQFRPTP